ncbi:MAG TPA: hypothetical protein VNO18_06645, partial [Xanthobacteraceae bacterium]|nr:hypothetical protein [Xanthobacteraceae bacterium]
RLDAGLVHKGRIEGAELGCVCPRREINAFLAALEDFPNTGFGGNAQVSENADRTAIGRNDAAIVPKAVAIAEKIVTRPFSKIRAGEIKSPAPDAGRMPA